MKAVYRTDKGLIRATNQDSVVFDNSLLLFGVADGMGGHNGGDVASSTTEHMLRESLAGKEKSVNVLEEAIHMINDHIYEMQRLDPALNGMGTTLSVLWACENHVIMSHIGDSKVFLMHHQKLRQISRDHSLVGEMVRKGSMTPEEAKKSPYRNMITRAVGTSPNLEIDSAMFDLCQGDRWLICSDGLTEHVDEREIEDWLKTDDLEYVVDTLMSLALERGGRDNISILIMEVDQ